MPKVSVIIATYNRAHYIKEAVDSVLAQTFKDYEIVIVDDGSTDATKQVLQEYGDKIRYFYQDNQGQAKALSHAVREAKGEYLAFIDDDDMWLPEKLAIQMQVFTTNGDIGLVASSMYLTDKNGNITSTWGKPADVKENFESLFEENIIGFPSVVVRKDLVNRVGGFDETLITTQDYDLWLRLSKICQFKCIDIPLIKWRIHGSNKHQNKVQKLKDRLYIFLKPENMAHLGYIKRRIRISKIYYTHAEYFQNMGLYDLASKTYFKSAVINPFIGRYYYPTVRNTLTSSFLYRILRTYLRAFYCLLKHF